MRGFYPAYKVEKRRRQPQESGLAQPAQVALAGPFAEGGADRDQVAALQRQPALGVFPGQVLRGRPARNGLQYRGRGDPNAEAGIRVPAAGNAAAIPEADGDPHIQMGCEIPEEPAGGLSLGIEKGLLG